MILLLIPSDKDKLSSKKVATNVLSSHHIFLSSFELSCNSKLLVANNSLKGAVQVSLKLEVPEVIEANKYTSFSSFVKRYKTSSKPAVFHRQIDK